MKDGTVTFGIPVEVTADFPVTIFVEVLCTIPPPGEEVTLLRKVGGGMRAEIEQLPLCCKLSTGLHCTPFHPRQLR